MHSISSLWCFRFFSNFLIIWKLKLYFWNFLEQKNALTIEQQQGSVPNFVYLVFSITLKILQGFKDSFRWSLYNIIVDLLFQMLQSVDTRSKVQRVGSISRRVSPATPAPRVTPSPRTRIRDTAELTASGVDTLQDANVSRKCYFERFYC